MGLTQVSEKGIKDGEILNADINASAAIAGSKISPDFGSQNIVTTGTLTANNINANSGLDISIISGTVSAIFPNSSQVNGITGMPSQSGTPFVVAKDTGTNRSAIFAGNVATGNLDVTGAITGTGDLTIDTNTLHVDSTNNRVGIGSSTTDTGGLVIDKNITAESDAADTANYHLVVKSQTNSNTSKVGIAFKNTSDSTKVGAAILHHRTGGGSVGGLAFYTSPTTGTTTERTKITSGGTLLQGSGAIATTKATTGGLDIAANGHSIVFGADSNTGNVSQARTNNAAKDQRISAVHYTNAEEPIGVVRVYSDSSTNQLYWGGGSSLFNAATSQSFYTAANNTTTNGTERLRIHSGGTVNIPSGITLGQTIGSTAATNTLDDYEEGTFTPLMGGSNYGSYNITGTGKYTKIGRVVYFQLQFSNKDLDNNASGDMRIRNWPFTWSTTSARPVVPVVMMHNVIMPDDGNTNPSTYALYGGDDGISMYGIHSHDGTDWDGWSINAFQPSAMYLDLAGFYMV